MPPSPLPSPRQLAEAYEPGFRAGLTVPPERAEDPTALEGAAAALPPEAARLLELLLLVVPVGEPIPERLRPRIERHGEALWAGLLLLPRAALEPGSHVHPARYAGSCRVNPALAPLAGAVAVPGPADVPASFPPTDAWWDAVVVAAAFEANPGPLNQDGTLRKDVERRVLGALGPDSDRWSLAFRLGRLVGLLRPSNQRLFGHPEVAPRPLADPAGLFTDPASTQAASILRRLLRDDWIDLRATLARLGERARELLWSPRDGVYPHRPETRFDAEGWATVETRLFADVADALHRVGLVDAHRDADGVHLVRRPRPRPGHAAGFLLTPDNEILVHVGEIPLVDYGRLARLAPFVEGARLHRHRLCRDGVAADIAAGHGDPAAFLAARSRTGLPPSVADSLREWSRSATRITVVTGVDVVEEEDGRLRVARPDTTAARVIDYTQPPRGRFLWREREAIVPAGWDPLTVRAALRRIGTELGHDAEGWRYRPERRAHARPADRVEELRQWYGGDLPGELEALILAGAPLPPVRVRPAVLVQLPLEVAGALRRDAVAGRLLRRSVGPDAALVDAEEVPALRARLDALGIPWEG